MTIAMVTSPRAILAVILATLASRDVPGIATRYVALIKCVKGNNASKAAQKLCYLERVYEPVRVEKESPWVSDVPAAR